jgi:hypothetical protein
MIIMTLLLFWDHTHGREVIVRDNLIAVALISSAIAALLVHTTFSDF